MAVRFYHLSGSNPQDQGRWAGPSPLYGTIETADGDFVRNIQGPDASIGLYQAVREDDLEQCPLQGQIGQQTYYDRSVEFGLTGAVGSDESKVTETVACTQISIDRLAAVKIDSTNLRAQQAKTQGREFTLASGPAIVRNSEGALAVYQGYVTSLPGTTMIRLRGQFGNLYDTQVSEYPNMIAGISIFDHAGVDGTLFGHEEEIERLRVAGVWNDLANYDELSGYPAAPVNPNT